MTLVQHGEPGRAGEPHPGAAGEVLLSAGERTRVVRRWLPDATSVIVKEFLGPGAPARRRHEHDLLHRLAGVPGVVRPAGGADQDTIVLRDDGGRVLADVIAAAPLPIAEVTALARELARIIGAVHARGVVHKDINPSNVLLTGAGPVLIDFDLATTVAVDRPGFLSRRELAGTLPYVPPEQTGRTGLPIDHRADLYALGATLYELVSGHPPVSGDDDLRMIHDILLRVPEPLAVLRPDVPPALSDIVDRLLRKEPDRRYQSAEGVARDLARVSVRQAEGFALGEWDFPSRLSAPSRLIGRDVERQALCAALEDALAGGPRGLLVAGVPGVGKSALINELRQPVAVRHGWFVSGKAEQYHPHAAVGATLQAVRGTGRLLLAEPSDVLAATRRHLAGTLHTGLAAVTALLPEFAVLLGAAAETGAEAGGGEEAGEDTGDPATADARLRSAVVELLRVVVSPSRPLVLVVDDLQWADPVSLHLFDALLTEPDLPGLLVVGAYRAEEVDAGHPLTPMLARWQRLGASRPPLLLENLPAPESVRFVAELLRLTADPAAELDEELRRRTGGNPYDTLELVNALRRDGVLVLGEDGWSWDRAAVRSHVGHGDLLPVVRARIERLPAESVRLVCTMACLGGEIGVGLLARALDVPVATVRERLAPALEDGLLVPAGPAGAGDEADAGVRFRHDRVHQAAFTALGDAERTALRLTLARRLAGESAVAAAEQYLAAGELDDDAERRTAARLYRTAAAYAERAGNYPVAERFLTAAVGLLTAAAPGSAEDPELQAVRVRQHAARYALGRLDDADEVYAAIEATATDPLLLAAVADVQLNSLAQRGRQAEALPLGLRLLARLGRPAPPGKLAADLPGACRELVEFADSLDLDEDLARPPSTDPRILASTRLYSRLLPIASMTGRMPVSLWITLDSSRIWRRHGPSAELAAVLGVLGLLVMQLRDEYRPGFRAGRHMLAYSEARGSEVLTATLRHRYAMQVLPWTAPLDRIIEQLRSSYEGLVRGGDLQMASTTSFAVLPATLECGRSVESLAAEIEAAAAFAGRTGNGFSQPVIAAYRQLARALQGRTAAPGSLEEDGFAEAEHLSRVSSHRPGLAHYHLCRSLAAALFGDWGALERHTRIQAEALARQPVPGYPLALVHVLRALSCAGQLRRDPGPEAARALGDELGRARDWLAARAGDAPENFRHLLHLVEAERAWAGGDPLTALAAGDAALAAVEAVQRPWHRAFILERAAALHEAYGLHRSARQLLAEARRAYLDWGADGKVRQLDESFPELRTAAPRGAPAGGRGGSIRADVVDTLAILRASQALSSATGLVQLQAAMAEQLTALTGAADVVLALRDGDDWFVPAGPRTGDSAVPVEEAGRRGLMPLTAFRYARRTGEPLLVDDATRDDRFARDPYLAGAERCSLLVMPIFHHDVPQAMLVLSNLYAGGVFTTDRLDAVTLIAGQLAVSLNNALLYASLEERVAERTRALAAANDQLERLSVTDALTGLPNRRAFQRVAAEAWGRLVQAGSPFAVAMIDIDFFKPYNDRNGHQAGDECLRRVAGALGASVRGASDLACRYGGEEFVLVLADSDEAQAAAVAERTRAGVEALRIPHPDNPAGVVTVSVGLAIASDTADGTADALLARADAALYAAKEQGRNRVGRALSAYR